MTKFLVGLEKFLHSLTHSFCRHIVKTFTFLYLFLKQQKVLHLFCQHPTESPETSRFMFIGTQCDLWGRPDGTGHEKISRGNFPRLIFSLIPSLFERHISIGCADLIWDITLDEISALCLFIGRGPFFA